jgi:hypothetical protein
LRNLAPASEGRGYTKPEYRAGFLDMWEGANEFEFTTHPYEGTIYDRDGKEITFKDEFRVDFAQWLRAILCHRECVGVVCRLVSYWLLRQVCAA